MRKQLTTILELIVLPICVLLFAATVLLILVTVFGYHQAGQHDFVEYWSSGRLALQHKNPYGFPEILALEVSAHSPWETHPLVMGNPPWTLPLLIPFAPVPVYVGAVLWFCLSVISLLWSVRVIARLSNRPASLLDLFGYAFAPALVCLAAGQMNILLLLGLIGFFLFHEDRPTLAGACLWLCLLKPHLFVPFGCVLFLWLIGKRRYSILAGALGAVVIMSAIAMSFDPHVWSHYFAMMRSERLDLVKIPCLSIALRKAASPHVPWIQWVPVSIGSIWSVYFFTRHKNDWSWTEHGSLLVLVSLVVAPYTWLMDQAIAIPALLFAVYRTRSRVALAVLALGSAVIELTLFKKQPLLVNSVSGWSSLFWLVWYMVTTRQRTMDAEAPGVGSVDLAGVNA